MKIKRKLIITIIIIFLTGTITPLSLFVNNSLILIRIYYKITYGANIQNFESIVEKSELFDYLKYCKSRDIWGEIQNLSGSFHNYKYHIDREFIESLKLKIDKDKGEIHLFPYHQQNFIYSLEVTNESLIYLNYNNDAIIKAEYANHTEIFAAEWTHTGDRPSFWSGDWYTNFTEIPSTVNYNSTIILSNIFLVKMNLKYNFAYNFWESQYLTVEQYLIFNSNFQTMVVYIPGASLAVQ